MSVLRELRKFTFDEYLSIEENASFKSEFMNGIIYRLPGGSFNHVFIANNISFTLNLKLTGKECRVGSSDLMVSDSLRSFSHYPDVLVVCGKPLSFGGKKNVLLNPRVIVEVLSPSTEADDRGYKFMNYQSIPALEWV